MTDEDKLLVERLRRSEHNLCSENREDYGTMMTVAECLRIADRITALSAEVERLKGVLTNIANAVRIGPAQEALAWEMLANACQSKARAALTDKGN